MGVLRPTDRSRWRRVLRLRTGPPGARAVAAVACVLALLLAPAAGAQEQQEERRPPPPQDQVGGFQISVFGGSQFVGGSSGQVGAVLGYFFKPTSRFGIELEAGNTFGPGGNILHGSANLVLQAGARTSRIVPYATAGVGVFHASVDLPGNIQDKLDEFGLALPGDEETAPAVNFGGGVRYYLSEGISLRGDFREYRAVLDVEGNVVDRLFSLRRVAGMISFEF